MEICKQRICPTDLYGLIREWLRPSPIPHPIYRQRGRVGQPTKYPPYIIVGRVHIEQCQTNINTAVSVPVLDLVDIPTARTSRVQPSLHALDSV